MYTNVTSSFVYKHISEFRAYMYTTLFKYKHK